MLGFISELWKMACANKGPRSFILISLGQIMPLNHVSHGKRKKKKKRRRSPTYKNIDMWLHSFNFLVPVCYSTLTYKSKDDKSSMLNNQD